MRYWLYLFSGGLLGMLLSVVADYSLGNWEFYVLFIPLWVTFLGALWR